MITLPIEDLLASLDLPKIENEILTDPDNTSGILGFEFEEVKALVVAAAAKWLIPDLTYVQPAPLHIEEPFEVAFEGTKTRGIIDLGGQLSWSHWKDAYRGKVFVADWKTASGELDKVWEGRLLASKQWRLYACAYGADLISYRGVSRNGKTREYLIEVPVNNQDYTSRFFTQMGGMITRFMDTGADVWPTHMPSACGQYGTTCPFLDDCTFDKAPRYPLNSADLVLSYSSTERFQTCPEKFRRLAQIETRGRDGSESTRTGAGFHRGIAETYRQAFAQYGNLS